jgi:hypothetical protein
MSTKRPTTPRLTPLEEAADPATDPERLRKIARLNDDDVKRAAWKNPSVPEDVWRDAFLEGFPESWANPMAPFYVLAWTPQSEEEKDDVFKSARWATQALWETPGRCSPEGKVLILAKVQEWWATSEAPLDMMNFLGWWAQAKGDGSTEHLEVVRLTVQCVRTVRFEMLLGLTDKDGQALDLLEAWSTGGKDRRNEAQALTDSSAVTDTVRFALDSSHGPENALWEAQETVVDRQEDRDPENALIEYERHLAGVIRRERPLPPVVD